MIIRLVISRVVLIMENIAQKKILFTQCASKKLQEKGILCIIPILVCQIDIQYKKAWARFLFNILASIVGS